MVAQSGGNDRLELKCWLLEPLLLRGAFPVPGVFPRATSMVLMALLLMLILLLWVLADKRHHINWNLTRSRCPGGVNIGVAPPKVAI